MSSVDFLDKLLDGEAGGKAIQKHNLFAMGGAVSNTKCNRVNV